MKSTIHKIVLTITALLLGFFSLTALPVFAANDTETTSSGYFDVCEKLDPDSAAYKTNGCGNNTEDSFANFIINIINIIMGVIAIVAVITIIIGGVQYMTSTGDSGKLKKAKDTIMYSIIGLIIVSLAAVIVNFVIKAATASTSTTESTSSTTSTSYTDEFSYIAANYNNQINK